MNFAQVKAELRTLGVTIRKRDGEYRVAFADLRGAEQEASAYYTTDLIDAYDTAGAMGSKRQDAQADAKAEEILDAAYDADLDAWDAIVAGEY